ncbi:Molybdopterin biosynthesis protein MoeA [Olavius algarvensis associated proteobacterium Delta 3]|nr:Molybdopterin biosynthesis protein MoeA [Olavius algarvensis associated proteobacterium Delta 3]CAB5133272.1 Molybdopterin biosynthesis protein MoeA [Olavius algarvensis associated proteobacterium Delta 3]
MVPIMESNRLDQRVCGRPLGDCLEIIERFHGWQAPGLVLGLFMVDMASEFIGKGVEADAIVETRHCLPDAIQLFTPCTVGNGWMKILDWDKFALSLYDRWTKQGVRVWLDLDKAARYTNLYKWYMRLIPKKALPLPVLLDTILEAGQDVLSSECIKLTQFHKREKKTDVLVCPICNEAFKADQGNICFSCQGGGYYESIAFHAAAAFGNSR